LRTEYSEDLPGPRQRLLPPREWRRLPLRFASLPSVVEDRPVGREAGSTHQTPLFAKSTMRCPALAPTARPLISPLRVGTTTPVGGGTMVNKMETLCLGCREGQPLHAPQASPTPRERRSLGDLLASRISHRQRSVPPRARS